MLEFSDVVDVDLRAALLSCYVAAVTVMSIIAGQLRGMGSPIAQLIAQTQMATEVGVDPARVRANDIQSAAGLVRITRQIRDWQPRLDFDRASRDVLNHWRTASLC